jgi:predicted PhzF superfamily epimerase YddE/YHI9
MIVKMLLVDACTDGLFSGGRVAVAFLRHLGQEVFLGALADELGFPVTAYILPHQDEFITRCFTPGQGEIDAHNYAALAAAHSIYGVGLAPADKPVVLHGRGGSLKFYRGAAESDSICLDLAPARGTAAPPDIAELLHSRLGLAPADLLKAEYVGADQLLIFCRTMAAMDGLDFAKISGAFPQTRLALSAPLDSLKNPGYVLRGFSRTGAPENAPMTLSIHAVLGAFWADSLNKPNLEVHYLSPRTSRLWVSKNSGGEVSLRAQVSTIFRADPVMKELSAEGTPDALF